MTRSADSSGHTVTAELGFVSPAYHVEVRDRLMGEIDRLRAHLLEIQIAIADGGFPSEMLPRIRNHVALALYTETPFTSDHQESK